MTATKHDFDVVLEQAKIVIPVLSILIFLVMYFGWRHFQEQQDKQNLQARFDLARTLIEGHHYARARTVLGSINDPKARDWETKLRHRIPDNPNFLQQFQ